MDKLGFALSELKRELDRREHDLAEANSNTPAIAMQFLSTSVDEAKIAYMIVNDIVNGKPQFK